MNKNILSSCLMVLVFFGLIINPSFAQDVETAELNGTVYDKDGEPMEGVLIESFNTLERKFTDAEGKYTINVTVPNDQLIVSNDGYQKQILPVNNGNLAVESITLLPSSMINGADKFALPYQSFDQNRMVSPTTMITGEELQSYPSENVIEALSARLPGLTVSQVIADGPGRDVYLADIRGEDAVFYIDGIQRDPSYLSVFEVDRVYLLKDISSRAALGVSASGPVIWIETIAGESYNRQINVNFEYGVYSPTETPGYLDAFDYASLRNEAALNDGLPVPFSDDALAGYQNGTNPLRYPNVDYYNQYLNSSAMFSRANLNFSGGDDKVNYFTMLDYTGRGGLEAVGEPATYDRYKARANVNLYLTEYISMNVNLVGSISTTDYPNFGGGNGYMNLYSILPGLPANAHPNNVDGLLFTSANYQFNVENELLNGFAKNQTINTQNNATLNIDLSPIAEGLEFAATGAFDVNNQLTEVQGGTSDIWRTIQNGNQDSVFRFTPAAVDATRDNGFDWTRRVTSLFSRLTYNNTFGNHAISSHLSYYQAVDETKILFGAQQPFKIQDVAARANYSFDNRYVAQVDLSYTGSMRLPSGDKFNLYPTVGAAWIASNEAFLNGSSAVNYLKVYGSAGQMGINSTGYSLTNRNLIRSGLGIGGVNEFYLDRTLWEQVGGGYTFGTFTDLSAGVNTFSIAQQGTTDYTLPVKNYLNVGVQSELFNLVSVEANYFFERNSGLLSRRASQVPDILGQNSFIPVTNFGENTRYGIDGMISLNKRKGDLKYNIGINAVYSTGTLVTVDEPLSLPDSRKRSGTPIDAIFAYTADGLFQTQEEVDAHVPQAWGDVQPGDIRYVDIDGDGQVNENDLSATDLYFPRLQYGVNVNLNYKGFGLFVLGQGQADGTMMLTNPNFFWIQGVQPNFSEAMLDRWPNTNDYPRLTTASLNNYQGSTFWTANAAFFRLKNVQLSYSLPESVVSRLAMSNATIFVRGTNLLVLSEVTRKYGISPERPSAGAGAFPIMRTTTIGLTCRF